MALRQMLLDAHHAWVRGITFAVFVGSREEIPDSRETRIPALRGAKRMLMRQKIIGYHLT